MSKFNLVAVAIAAALAAPAAFATTVTVSADGTPATTGPEIIASNTFVDAGDTASNYTKRVDIAADATSVYLGRNTGYNVRLTLSQGVFAKQPAAVAIGSGAANPVNIAGGGDNANTVTYSVTPATSGVVQGDGIRIAATNIEIDGVAALGAGGQISANVQVFDPVGGNQLGATIPVVLIRTIEGWAVTFTAGASTQRVDVGATSAKRFFGTNTVGSGLIGTLFNAGTVAIAPAEALTYNANLDTATAMVDLSVTGANFGAFKAATGGNGGSVYLSDAVCAAPGTVLTVAANNQSAAISGEVVDDVDGKSVCFDGNGVSQIAAQAIGATAEITDAAQLDSPVFAGSLRAMAYNGAVENVWHFNPASNADQQSYLRLTNTSSTAGLVTVASTCDNGQAASGTATLTVAAGQSVLLTSGDIENGNASKGVSGGTGGCATGKNRLEITGEFASMQVQNFLRNTTSAGLINTNVNNEK